ncbi:MAG: hypothetical protein EXR69_08740 [Myxococcales bacterium]|nr:hypothetical protein [Myxococcales bacterium]
MTLLICALLIVSPAAAGVKEDAATAADPTLENATREAAYRRLMLPESTAEVKTRLKAADLDPQQRWVLIRSLGPNPSEEARLELLALAESKNAMIRAGVMEAFGDRGDRNLTGKVLKGLSDPALLVHAAALDALIQLKDPSALADLDHALRDKTGVYHGTSFRQKIVDAEAACGRDGARYLVVAMADKDADVVTHARAGLEKIAGFSYREGRTPEQEIEAWRRWAER